MPPVSSLVLEARFRRFAAAATALRTRLVSLSSRSARFRPPSPIRATPLLASAHARGAAQQLPELSKRLFAFAGLLGHSRTNMMPLSSSTPVASTSRIPYAPPADPARARALHTSRPFFSPRRSGSARAHLIHPLARQRLTNLSFLLAGALSVVTVSLGMSGTFGDAAPGCPARKDARVALEGAEAYGPSGGRGEPRKRNEAASDAGWWKGKGRFLDDPVVPAQQAHGAAAPRGAYVPPARSAQAPAREDRVPSAAPAPAVPASDHMVESARIADGGARIGGRAAEQQQQHRTGGWTSWMGTNERVV